MNDESPPRSDWVEEDLLILQHSKDLQEVSATVRKLSSVFNLGEVLAPYLCDSGFMSFLFRIIEASDENLLNEEVSAGLSCADACLFIAELAKYPENRPQLERFLEPLVKSLDRASDGVDHDVNGLERQIFRAIGNICFENDSGRSVFLAAKGTEVLLRSLASLITLNGSESLVHTVMGCLNNVLDCHQECQRAFLGLGFVDILEMTLLRLRKSGTSATSDSESFILHCLSCMADHPGGLEAICGGPVGVGDLSRFLMDHVDERVEEALALLMKLADHGDNKSEMVRVGILEELLNSCDRLEEEEESDTAAAVANFVVELSADPGCVAVLDDRKVDGTLDHLKLWLGMEVSSDGLKRVTTAALVVGNLTIRAENATKLMEEGVHTAQEGAKSPSIVDVLLKKLEKTASCLRSLSGSAAGVDQQTSHQEHVDSFPEMNGHSQDRPDRNDATGLSTDQKMLSASDFAQLQFALLSAVKNLAVSEEIRRRLYVELPVVDVLVGLFHGMETMSEVLLQILSPNINKLLTILRMLAGTDKASATKIGQNEALLNQMIHWTKLPSVGHEALRFMAVLLRTSEFASAVVCSVGHAGMQRALLALLLDESVPRVMSGLALLSVCLESENLAARFVELDELSSLLKGIENCLTQEKLPPDGLAVVIRFAEWMCRFEALREALRDSDVVIRQLSRVALMPDISVKANALLGKLTQ